jgi:3-isopropylmalate dehydrogenase
MAPAIEVLQSSDSGSEVSLHRLPANYLATGKSMPDSTVRLCEEADAILLGACGLPSVRYPDNTEIAPQIELRFHFDLYAGVRPARLIPGVPSPIVGADQRGIDLVLIRESTEGLFASMGKGVVTDTEARDARDHRKTRNGCSVFVPPRRTPQAPPGEGPDRVDRQTCSGVRVLSRDVR